MPNSEDAIRDERARLEASATQADHLEAAMSNGAIQVLLDKLERDAFEQFKQVDHEDAKTVLETQVMGAMVRNLGKLIRAKIDEGHYDRQQLVELSLPKEDD